MASHDVKSTMCIIAMNIFLEFLRCAKGRAKFGTSICVGTAKLLTNRPSSTVWPQSCKQLCLLVFFRLVVFGGVFWVWIQLPVGSLGCLMQEYRGCWLQVVEGSAVCWRLHLEEPFVGKAFSVLMLLFSYSAGFCGIHLCKVLLLCVHIAR